MDHRYADVNGIRLHYVTAGRGPLILFLHGFPEFWYAWKDQLAEFGRDHRAVAPDMRGYNLSSKPAEVAAYSVKHLVADVRALVDHLEAKTFVLVGHDWGGVVAWAFAIRHPDRLEKLVIVNAPHPAVFERELRENPAQQAASGYMLIFRIAEAEEILAADNHRRLLAMFTREGAPFSDEDRAQYLAAWSQPGALNGGLNYYRAAGVGPPTPEGTPARGFSGASSPRTVTVPTLVIWGERDSALLTGNLDGLEAFVPNLTIRRVPEGSHWVVHQQPGLVNRLIRDFLAVGT
jgi:pimeloyl-ACP methyl ester carboxylesterase